jgi:hypothetical protein
MALPQISRMKTHDFAGRKNHMSDADDQMGGQGGETGPAPEDPKSGKPDEIEDRESEQSFPASDPPANY